MPEARGILLSAEEYKESEVHIRAHTLERSCAIKVNWWFDCPNKCEVTVEIAFVQGALNGGWDLRNETEGTNRGRGERSRWQEERSECICTHRKQEKVTYWRNLETIVSGTQVTMKHYAKVNCAENSSLHPKAVMNLRALEVVTGLIFEILALLTLHSKSETSRK